MITPMKKITVFALQNSRKTVMEGLQKMGCVELKKTADEEKLSGVSVKEQTQSFERNMAAARSAIEILDDIVPEKKGMFDGKESTSIQNYSLPRQRVEKINKCVHEIISKNKKINEISADIAQRKAKILALKPWSELDIEMNFNSLKNAEVALYTLNALVSVEYLDGIFDGVPGVYYEIISAKSDFSCVWFLSVVQ